jgi:hypothetical protein
MTGLLFLLSNVDGATIYVPDDYATIQEAINAVANGDTIIVKPGTYVELIDFSGKAITLRSEQGADFTIIDGNFAGTVVRCESGEGPDTILDGFTICNGYTKDGGGGMINIGSSPTITNCIFFRNSALGQFFPPFIYPAWGGGMTNCSSSPTVINCLFCENSADGIKDGYGGGMLNAASNPTVINCTFSGNYAFGYTGIGYGGGMYNEDSHPIVTGCTFSGNYSYGYGGGMCNHDADPTVTNCILWDNTPDEIDGTATVTFSDVKGGYPGTGNIDANPLFIDLFNSDFHLAHASPCINRGTNDVTLPDDIDGDPRPFMGTVDMGADEYTGIHLLEADTFTVSEMTGGTVNFLLNTGSGNLGRTYLILGSVSGTAPGTPLPGGHEDLRLNWDGFTDLVLDYLNSPVFMYFLGTIWGAYKVDTQLNVPPLPPGTAGITMHYAFCLGNPFDFVSNPVAIEIVP